MSECNCVDTGHKQDCPLGKDLRIAAMQEQIAILETSLAERWESLNVQDGIIDGLQDEIAALRAERATLSNGLIIQTDQVEHSEKVIEELEKVAEHAAALFYNHELTETWDALEEALREAGYLKEDGDVLA